MAVQAAMHVSGGCAIALGAGMFSPNSLTESLAKGIPYILLDSHQFTTTPVINVQTAFDNVIHYYKTLQSREVMNSEGGETSKTSFN